MPSRDTISTQSVMYPIIAEIIEKPVLYSRRFRVGMNVSQRIYSASHLSGIHPLLPSALKPIALYLIQMRTAMMPYADPYWQNPCCDSASPKNALCGSAFG